MTPDLPIRLAAPRDAVDIALLSRRCIEQGLPWSWRPERVARAIRSPSTNTAVVRGAGGLAGFGIMSYGEDDAHLLLFAVDPACRRQGLGRAILGWLEASAAAAGARRIRLEARRDNDAARSFYNEHGYHEVRLVPRLYGGVADGVRLEKWLRGRDAPAGGAGAPGPGRDGAR